jgi:hypothetical protein
MLFDPMRLRVALTVTVLFACSASKELDQRSQEASLTNEKVVQDTSDRGRSVHTQDTSQNAERPAQDSAGVVIPLHFKPAVGESVAVVRALRVAIQRTNGPQVRRDEIRAQLFRVDPTPRTRYLLFAAQPRFMASDGEHWGRSFYILDLSNGNVTLSPPLDMKDAEYVTVETLRDVNGDGIVDLVYCKGYEGEEELPRHFAATFRGGHWEPLPDALVKQGNCKGTPY